MRKAVENDRTKTMELLAKYRANSWYGRRTQNPCYARHCNGGH